MTDRHSGYLVVLEADLREDDAQAVIDALRMVKGVADVIPHIPGNLEDRAIMCSRRDRAWREALTRLLTDGPG